MRIAMDRFIPHFGGTESNIVSVQYDHKGQFMIESSKSSRTLTRPTYGMVGGGEGAFIGDVHRKAIGLDGKATLVAGSFSSDPINTSTTGRLLGLDESRCYTSYQEMAQEEGAREDGIDFVSIVTPNFLHYDVAKTFLKNGINVVCDKPLTFEVDEAEELAALARKNDLLFCVTYTYTGYPIVKHVRDLITAGDIGKVRFINAEYAQEWMSTKLEDSGQKQAAWRSDPKRSGKSNCVGDIGSHIENMVSYMTGLKINRLVAKLDTHVPGRILDDNATIMLEYEGGATGLYWCSQIAVGHDNGLRIRIYGEKGSIEWAQEDPNYVILNTLDGPKQILSRGRDPLKPNAEAFSRIPAGHPEGYFEAFANVYGSFIDALVVKKTGQPMDVPDFPTVQAGIDGVRFIGKCVESSQNDGAWVKF